MLGRARGDRAHLLEVLAAATDGDPDALAGNYEQYGPLKADTAAAVIAMLEPIQQRLADYDDDDVIKILGAGADKARAVAAPVMDRARIAAGLLT